MTISAKYQKKVPIDLTQPLCFHKVKQIMQGAQVLLPLFLIYKRFQDFYANPHLPFYFTQMYKLVETKIMFIQIILINSLSPAILQFALYIFLLKMLFCLTKN